MDQEKDKKDTSNQGSRDLYNSSSLVLKAQSDIAAQRQNVIKRTERIVTAIYLVSTLLPESDPLRLSLRNQALDFLSFITDAVDFFQNISQQHVVEGVALKTQALISLLGIAHISGYVSDMNRDVIVRELTWFAEEVAAKGHLLLSGIVLEDGFFAATPVTPVNPVIQKNISHKSASSQGQNSTKRRSQIKKPIVTTQKAASKNARTEKIVDIVRKQGPITIKDIAAQVKECGEKTIQRELMSLVKDNIIKRQGERRWSVYSVV